MWVKRGMCTEGTKSGSLRATTNVKTKRIAGLHAKLHYCKY